MDFTEFERELDQALTGSTPRVSLRKATDSHHAAFFAQYDALRRKGHDAPTAYRMAELMT